MPHFAPLTAKPSDVVLRSSDGVVYNVHSRTLGKFSDVLGDICERARGSTAPIVLAESSAILDVILPFFYEHSELADLPSQSVGSTARLYEVCIKFAVSALVLDPIRAHALCVLPLL